MSRYETAHYLVIDGGSALCLCLTSQIYRIAFSQLLTSAGGVPIDVAGHEPPSFSVLDSTLGLLEGEARPLDDVVTPLLSWPPSSALALDHALK